MFRTISKTLLILSLTLSSFVFAQESKPVKSPGKRYYTLEEVRQRCGIYHSEEQRKKMQIKQDSMYKAYLQFHALHKETGITTIPNWQNYMGPVEDQGSCGNCWAQSAVGVTEGKLHYFIGSKVGIDLDENDVTNNSGGGSCSGGYVSVALSYIQNSRVPVEPGYSSFPNNPGVKYSISGYSSVYGIDAIKSALNSSPVVAVFDVYQDFYTFFGNTPGGVYRYNNTASYVGGHAVVIVGYDDVLQCWVCKNSWGTNWGVGGYFKIAYGQCGIDTYENYSISVNQGSLAKIVPNFFSTLNSVTGYSFSGTEAVYLLSGTQTLSANINAASGVTMYFQSGSTINLGSYYIIAGGFSISASIPSLNAYLKQGSGTRIGLFPSIQSCCNYAGSGQWVELLPKTYNENITLSSKNSINITGYGSLLNGTVNINSSSYCNLYGLHLGYGGSQVYINGGTSNRIIDFQIDNGTGLIHMFNSTTNTINHLTATNGEDIDFGCSAYNSTGDVCNSSTIEGNMVGVYLSDNARFNVTDNYFCSNGYDVDAESGAFAYLLHNTYSHVNPLSAYGNYTYIQDYPERSCSGSMMAKAGSSSTANPITVTASDETNKLYLELINKIEKDDLKEASAVKEKYNADYNRIISKLKDELKKNSDISSLRSTLSLIMHCYKGLGDTDTFLSYLNELLSDSKLQTLSSYIKKYMIDSYIEAQDYNGGIALADEVLASKGIDQNLTCEMLYEKGIIYKHFLKNNSEAYKALSAIIEQYPKNNLAKLAKGQISDLPKNSDRPYIASLSNESDGITCSNYPNPFNPVTRFSFSIPKDDYTELRIYNSLGQEIKTLVSEHLSKGRYSFEWNANGFASGIYYYTLKCGELVSSHKMILMK